MAGPGLLSIGRRRTVQAARPRPHRNPHRGDGRLCDHVDDTIRRDIPAKEVVTIVDNIGLPYSGLNLSYSTSAPVDSADADIQVQLSRTIILPELRRTLAQGTGQQYPGVTFTYSPWTSSRRF